MALGAACSDGGTTSSASTAGAPSTSLTLVGTTAATTASTTTATSVSPTGARNTTTTAATTTSAVAPRQSAARLGYGEIAFTIGPAGGPAAGAAQRCALLAETDQQQAKGLMGRRDLAGYDAMVFRFAFDGIGAFYMRNVPVGLSIAWFASNGRFVSSTAMSPCPDQEGCPTYAPTGPYRFAVEVLEGGLGRLGIGEGSVLSLGGPCAR